MKIEAGCFDFHLYMVFFMRWSLDFDISALIVCIIFLVYYYVGKNLPIRRNRIFLGLLVFQFLFTFFDITASIISSYPEIFDRNLIILSNILYYLTLTMCPVLFALFCYYVINSDKVNPNVFILIHFPALICIAIVLCNPFTEFIFSVDQNGVFNYGVGRPLFYFETLLYMAFSFVCVLVNPQNVLRKKHTIVLFFYMFITVFVHTLQVFLLPYKQTVALGVVGGITAVFLCFENPDYYRDRRTDLFNTRGLQLYEDEEYYYGNCHAYIGFVITNYSYFKFVDNDLFISELLRKIAKYLQLRFKKDAIFYFHNGTFIIAQRRTKNPLVYRDILLERFSKPFYYNGGSITFEPCFFYDDGSVSYTDYNDFADTLFIAIDKVSKSTGDKTLKITNEIRLEAIHRREIESALKRSLENPDNVEVYYQPIYSNIDKRIISAEALVRINDPEQGLIFPDDFIYLAERNGCIMKLGNIIFTKVCKMISENDITRYGLENIKINISPYQCMYRGMSNELISIMKKFNVDPKFIGMEITETETSDKTVIMKNIDRLMDYGVEFSLDDYGTGYSNLVNILNIPFKIIKIDKSICWDYFRSGNTLLVDVIHQLSSRNKEIVVEGVEDEEMSTKLAEFGVQYEQGYYFSKPIPYDKFIEYLESNM